MTTLAPTLQTFFTDRLQRQRQASPHTIAAYRDAIRLLVAFATEQTGTEPSQLDIGDLDADLVGAFLNHLEDERGNSPTTRNTRLSAIRSLFRYAALRHPEHAATIQQVLAIPPKRTDQPLISWLNDTEVDALLTAPETTTWTGRRDHTLLVVAIETGLRISELIGLQPENIHLHTGAHISCVGKGRKQRITPISPPTVKTLRRWLNEQQPPPGEPVFPTRRGNQLSRDAIERRLAIHVASAATTCPTIGDKKITAHVLRHTCAMRLLHAGIDTTVIALWLGHESVETTQIYVHADLKLKEQALARTTPPNSPPGRYRPPDSILAFLDAL